MHFVIGLVAVFWLISKISSCSEPAEVKARREAEHREFIERSRAAEESVRRAREEGARALEEADKAIREANASRRSDLERRAVSHRMANRNGVRVDQYTMPDGRVVTCTTTISGNSPAIFNCD